MQITRTLLAIALIVAPKAADAQPPPKIADFTVTSEKARAVERELSAVLSKSFNGAKTETRSERGPLGLTVVTAALEHPYPGSGVLRVLLDADGVTYGVHGEKDFADLVRARKWLTGPLPDTKLLVRLADVAFFEGVAILMDAPAPTVTRKGAWMLTLYRTWHPSGGKTRVRITVPANGKAEVVSENVK